MAYAERGGKKKMDDLEVLAVIPARYASTRLPAKPLHKLCGRELVLRVLDGVRGCRSVGRTIVATDDERIAEVVRREGGEAMMTPPELPTGSDRVAHVARIVPSRFVLNVQGDDPLVCGEHIDPMIDALRADGSIELAVLAKEIEEYEELARASIVKMVFGQDMRAIYFSRSQIPYPRGDDPITYYKHIGPYAWRRDALFAFAEMTRGPLERAESLEMLRMLEHGRPVACVKTDIDCIEIDTPEDVRMFEEYISRAGR